MRFVACLIFLLPAIQCYSISDWNLEKDASGVKVWTRKNSDSRIKEFKAVTTINAGRIEIARCITRVTDYINWFPDTGESKIVEIISPTKRKTYFKLDLPWPTTDRDCFMIMRVETDNTAKTTTVHFNDTPGQEVYGCVRMASSDGFWRVKELSDNACEVTYQFLSDPAGALPSWLINLFIVDNPHKTMLTLKNKMEE